MTRDEMERWQKLRVACLEIVQGVRTLRVHADELVGPERAFLENVARIVPDAEALALECQQRLGQRTARRVGSLGDAATFNHEHVVTATDLGADYDAGEQDYGSVATLEDFERFRTIFVFGSNLAGRHGKGAALEARQRWGAEYGVGRGPTGRAYAIPTKDAQLKTLPLAAIDIHVRGFIAYAKAHPELRFYVTRVGCGLAGYSEAQIRPMFEGAPDNCDFTWEGA